MNPAIIVTSIILLLCNSTYFRLSVSCVRSLAQFAFRRMLPLLARAAAAGVRHTVQHASTRFGFAAGGRAGVMPAVALAMPAPYLVLRHDRLPGIAVSQGEHPSLLFSTSFQCSFATSPNRGPENGSPRAASPSVITSRIVACKQLGELHRVIDDHGSDFDRIHLRVAIGKVVDMSRSGDCTVILQKLKAVTERALESKSLDLHALTFTLHAIARLNVANPELVRTAYGYPSHRSPSQPTLIEKLADAVVDVGFSNVVPLWLVDCMWALAKLEFKHYALVNMCMQHAGATQFRGFSAQHLPVCFWSVAALNIHGDAVDHFISDWLSAALNMGFEDFTEKGLASCIWAVATLDLEPCDLLSRFLDAWLDHVARRGLQGFSEQGISNIFVALVKLEHHNAAFLSTLTKHALTTRFSLFNDQNLSNSIHSLASLWALSNEFVDAWTRRVDDARVDCFIVQGVAVSLWSLSVWRTMVSSGDLPPPLSSTDAAARRVAVSLFRRLLRDYDRDPKSVSPKALAQCFQAIDCLPELLPELQGARSSFFEHAKAAFKRRHAVVLTSNAQGQMLEAVQSLGYAASMETPSRDGAMCMDVQFTLPDGRVVAVEFDGPRHFCSNQPYRLNGSTRLRNAMLRRRVDEVINMPFYEWMALNRASKAEEWEVRRDWFRQRIAKLKNK